MATATMTDSELQRDVLAELKWEPSVNAAHIGVAVKDGIVTLSGHVSSYPEMYAAERAAKRVYGVKAVVNEIRALGGEVLVVRADVALTRGPSRAGRFRSR